MTMDAGANAKGRDEERGRLKEIMRLPWQMHLLMILVLAVLIVAGNSLKLRRKLVRARRSKKFGLHIRTRELHLLGGRRRTTQNNARAIFSVYDCPFYIPFGLFHDGAQVGFPTTTWQTPWRFCRIAHFFRAENSFTATMHPSHV